MARKLESNNGQMESADECPNCGAPVHPSLDCKRCDE